MKKSFFAFILALSAVGTVILAGCPNNQSNPNNPSATPTSTPAFVVTILFPHYTTDGATSLTAPLTINHGSSIEWNTTGHPLYIDTGTSCAVSSNMTFPFTYTFSTIGTYYFHCGIHGSCTSNIACPATLCTQMAGTVVAQ